MSFLLDTDQTGLLPDFKAQPDVATGRAGHSLYSEIVHHSDRAA